MLLINELCALEVASELTDESLLVTSELTLELELLSGSIWLKFGVVASGSKEPATSNRTRLLTEDCCTTVGSESTGVEVF